MLLALQHLLPDPEHQRFRSGLSLPRPWELCQNTVVPAVPIRVIRTDTIALDEPSALLLMRRHVLYDLRVRADSCNHAAHREKLSHVAPSASF